MSADFAFWLAIDQQPRL